MDVRRMSMRVYHCTNHHFWLGAIVAILGIAVLSVSSFFLTKYIRLIWNTSAEACEIVKRLNSSVCAQSEVCASTDLGGNERSLPSSLSSYLICATKTEAWKGLTRYRTSSC